MDRLLKLLKRGDMSMGRKTKEEKKWHDGVKTELASMRWVAVV
jgi:hypothetical protein